MENPEVAQVFDEVADLLDIQGANPFRIRAYRNAARTIRDLSEPLADRVNRDDQPLEALAGIGKDLAEKIKTILQTGDLPLRKELCSQVPAGLRDLINVPGLGPKRANLLYQNLKIGSLEQLRKAAEKYRIRELVGFGAKTEEKILKGIAFLEQRRGRRPLGTVLGMARDLEARLAGLPGVQRAAVAGSIRRRKEAIGDLDFLVVARSPAEVMAFFVGQPEVAHVYGQGATKAMVRLRNGMDADLRVVPAESWGAALNYFTGSKAHNVALRRIAIERGHKLNEYGVFDGDRSIAGQTEEEVYAALGLAYVPPELREDSGEIELARAGRLPRLIEPGSLRGDLQIQTTWTDGANSIEEMAAAARQRGRSYIAITDHTRSLAMTGGSDERQLAEQMQAIAQLNAQLTDFRILSGAEVNINRDGTLDIDDAALARLDVVGIAVHSHFNLPRAEQTQRIVRAMENPHADILFHPTGRRLDRRDAYDVDLDVLIAAAKRTGTVLEIDALPERMDLKDEHVRKAVEAGVPLVIDSDAHSVAHLSYPDEYGIPIARRGWATADDVINTLPLGRFLRRLKDRRGASRT